MTMARRTPSGAEESLLDVQNVSLEFRSRFRWLGGYHNVALRNVSFGVRPGETLGVLGRNGSGKSSLLQVLAGIVQPTRGRLVYAEGLHRALLTLGLGFRPDLSGKDNALLSLLLQGCSRQEARQALPHIETFTGLGRFFEQPVHNYSSGMRARLGFATALYNQVDLLLIDETLSVGDLAFRKKAEQALLKKVHGDQTVVFVSHAEGQVELLCNRAMWLVEGEVRTLGDTREVVAAYRQGGD